MIWRAPKTQTPGRGRAERDGAPSGFFRKALSLIQREAVPRVATHVLVIREVGDRIGIGGTVRNFHDDLNHEVFKPVPIGVIHLACDTLQISGFPRGVLDEFLQVTVAFGRGLEGRARDDRHVEEGIGEIFQAILKGGGKFPDDAVVDAVDDGRTDDHDVVFIPIHAFAHGFHHGDDVAAVAFCFNGFGNAAGNAGRVAGMTVVGEKNVLHFGSLN